MRQSAGASVANGFGDGGAESARATVANETTLARTASDATWRRRARRSDTEVGAFDAGIVEQPRRRAFERHAARFENVGARREFERRLDVLLDHHDRHARGVDLREDFEERVDEDGREPECYLLY